MAAETIAFSKKGGRAKMNTIAINMQTTLQVRITLYISFPLGNA